MQSLIAMPDAPEPLPEAAQTAIADLAARHRNAGGVLMKIISAAGGQVENRLELLPDAVKSRIEAATTAALAAAYGMAARTRGPVKGDRAHLAMATLTVTST